MKHRASRSYIYEQVRKDTKDICQQYGFSPSTMEVEPDMVLISQSIKSTIKDLGLEFARDKGEVKDALLIAESGEDMLLCAKHWIGRLLLSGKVLGSHKYERIEEKLVTPLFSTVREKREVITLYANLEVKICGKELSIVLLVEAWCEDRGGRVQKERLSIKGKPSRIIGKIFGEKFTTYMCQHYPIKSSKCELHFSRHYLPELYRFISEDEHHTSCMSKESGGYDLPDTHHPVMAYEDSPNAALALIWDAQKKRHVARAITNLDNMRFAKAYGTSGCGDKFVDAGLEWDDDMEGLMLSKKYYNCELLVPYVDGDTQRLSYYGDYLVVDYDGEVEGSYETGREVAPMVECACCGGITEEEDLYETVDGQVCYSCYNNAYVSVGGEMVHESDATYCEYAEEWYRDCDIEHVYEIRRTSGIWAYVVDENLEEALDHWSVAEIDGEDIHDWREDRAA